MTQTLAHVRQQKVLELQPCVRATARRMLRRRGLPVDLDELVSAGNVGLLEAIDRFDPSISPSFEAFAARRIAGAMLDFVRAQVWAPRGVATRARTIAETTEALKQELGRAPTRTEVAARLGITIERYDRLEASSTPRQMVSGDQRIYDDGSETLLTAAASNEPLADDQCAWLEHRQWMLAALHRIPENERLVLVGYYLDERTLSSIAAQLHLSEGRVSQLHHQALRRLRTLREIDEARGAAQPRPRPFVTEALDRLLAK